MSCADQVVGLKRKSERQVSHAEFEFPLIEAKRTLEQIHRRVADEPGDKGVSGLMINLPGPSDLLNPAVIHHDNGSCPSVMASVWSCVT